MHQEKNRYTKFEKARIIGARALQISANAPILIKLSKEDLEKLNYDPIKIAELEFEQGILPITVKRPLPKKTEKKQESVVELTEEEVDKEEKRKEKEAIKEEVAEEMKRQEQTEEEVTEEKEEELPEEDTGENF